MSNIVNFKTQNEKAFSEQRARSKVYEIAFSNWLQTRDWWILPTYDFSGSNDDKAPRLSLGNRKLVIPDLLAFRAAQSKAWFEIKVKAHADYNRKHACLVTGFAMRHLMHYREVKQLTGVPVYIVFIHEKEAVIKCCEIDTMPVSHEWTGGGMDRGGTVFLKFNALTTVAPIAVLDTHKLEAA